MSDVHSNNILNQALVITCKAMYKEGYITKEQYLEFISSYMIIATKPGWLAKVVQKIWKRDSETDAGKTYYDIVKIIHPDDNEADLELETLSKGHKSSEPMTDTTKSRFDALSHS